MRILIVDDHPIVISGCRAILAHRADLEVLEASDGETALAICATEQPQVAVIDINLPGISGLEVMRRILARDAFAKIIIFSMNEDVSFAARAIESGAKGYVTKNDDPADFIVAIEKVAAGGVYLNADLARQVAFHRVKLSSSPLDALTGREIEILRLLGAGKTMSEIASLIDVSYKTVANSCSLMKQKLAVRSPFDLVRIAVENRLM